MEVYSYTDYKQMLDAVLLEYLAKTATVRLNTGTPTTVFTFDEFKTSAERLGKQLTDAGLQRADRIAVIDAHYVFPTLAAISLTYLGYTAVMLDAALPIDEISRLVEQADVSAVFTVPDVYQKLELASVPCFELCEQENTYSPFPDSTTRCMKTARIPTDESVIAIIFSSGTTGSMKGVEITYTSKHLS